MVLINFAHLLQPRTARVPPALVPTVGRVSEGGTPSSASAKRAGRAPPVKQVSAFIFLKCAWLLLDPINRTIHGLLKS